MYFTEAVAVYVTAIGSQFVSRHHTDIVSSFIFNREANSCFWWLLSMIEPLIIFKSKSKYFKAIIAMTNKLAVRYSKTPIISIAILYKSNQCSWRFRNSGLITSEETGTISHMHYHT